ncbi:MAG: succinate--CoA ligase subunit alpha [Candidatus Saccharimonadales bacterium]
MQLLEHQAKALLRAADVALPTSTLLAIKKTIKETPLYSSMGSEVAGLIQKLDYPVVLKSQVPVGGRGKAGGIRIVRTALEFEAAYRAVATQPIKDHLPESILVEQALAIEREMYLALRVNRDRRQVEWLVASRGGIDIEENASSVKTVPRTKNDDAYETICDALKLPPSSTIDFLKCLEDCFFDNDCLLLEINPLVLTKTHELIAADAKLLVDDNALFRHSALASNHDTSSIIPLGGTIGVIANGAGMAMSTMDTIDAAGGQPANFLDIGGGTGEDVFMQNMRGITELPGVASIIINIFAGITRCDDIARGIIAAKREIPGLVPLYVRLEGTRRDEAAKLLHEAGIEIQPDLASCVRRALAETGSGKRETEDSNTPQATLAGSVLHSSEDSVTQRGASAHPGVSPKPWTGAAPRKELAEEGGNTHPVLNEETTYLKENSSWLAYAVFSNLPVIIQGITGHHGAFHTRAMIDAGTAIVAGVTPGKAGERIHGIPVYNTMAEAVSAHPSTTSVIFVPARFAKSALLEAIAAGIRLIVCITEGIPVHDMLAVYQAAAAKNATIIGPNCPGLIVPGSHKLGIIADSITTPGHTAIISRSGTLTYELADALSKRGIGQRLVLGIGGDPVQGTNFTEALQFCQADPGVKQMIMVGEIGGESEQHAADYAALHVTKPIYGLVVGHSLPPGQQFGHAGAIVGNLGESAPEKTDYLSRRGIVMAETLDELIAMIG